tara:strand:+ start:1279 stop:1635 length:357 start_codon:yes stop_codon:yes gene_type:complete
MTAQDVIDDVRQHLRDDTAGNYRWTDATLLVHLSDAERQFYQMRPDLFLTSSSTMDTPVDLTDVGDTLKLDEDNRKALVSWVSALALEEDAADEANLARAVSLKNNVLRRLGVAANGY